MLSPAFEMQYSARFTEAAYAETEVMKTIRPHPRSSIQPAASAVRKCGPFRLVAISSSKLYFHRHCLSSGRGHKLGICRSMTENFAAEDESSFFDKTQLLWLDHDVWPSRNTALLGSS